MSEQSPKRDPRPSVISEPNQMMQVINSERQACLDRSMGEEQYELLAGNSNLPLAQKIADQLGISVSQAMVGRFNDGECNIKLNGSVRNVHVFVLQSTCPGRADDRTINDHLMELFLLTRCFRRASAKTVTAIIPYYGYARQDEKRRPRVPIAASDVAMLLESGGVDRILAIDLHSAQIQGQFQHCPVDNLSMFEDFAEYFINNLADKYSDVPITIVSPDADGTARAKFFVGLLTSKGLENVSLAITIRQKNVSSIVVDLVGEIEGRHCVIVDDIIDTGSRVCQACEALMDLGADSVGAISTHGLFTGKALLKIEASDLDYCVVSDTIPLPVEAAQKTNKLISVCSAALLCEAIHSLTTGDQVAHLYGFGKE